MIARIERFFHRAGNPEKLPAVPFFFLFDGHDYRPLTPGEKIIIYSNSEVDPTDWIDLRIETFRNDLAALTIARIETQHHSYVSYAWGIVDAYREKVEPVSGRKTIERGRRFGTSIPATRLGQPDKNGLIALKETDLSFSADFHQLYWHNHLIVEVKTPTP